MDIKNWTWDQHQTWEKNWHLKNNNCANSYNEETKQYRYAHKMGLDKYITNNFGAHGWDFGNTTVIDIGGGPYSLLLKSKAKRMVVLDPADYPNWTKVRYKECGVELIQQKAEDADFKEPFDIGLMYNLLQHVELPEEIIKRARQICKKIYFFDWLGIGGTEGHPNILNEKDLNEWFGSKGTVDGSAYFGIFQGD